MTQHSSVTLPGELFDELAKQGGRLVMAFHETPGGPGEWLVACEWGKEEPDNPDNDMVAAASYGVGEDLLMAITQVLDEMRISYS